jgi:hypothetical protein
MRIVNPNNRVFILNYNSVATGQLFSYDCNYQFVTTNIFPWSVGSNGVSSFSDVLYNTLNTYLNDIGFQLNECILSTLITSWFVEIQIDGTNLIQIPFFEGFGPLEVPNDNDWRVAVNTALLRLIDFSYYYIVFGDVITIYNLLCPEDQEIESLNINVGINFKLECN